MRARISFVTRKARGGLTHRDEDLDSDDIRFGRAANSEIHLSDPRVSLEIAELRSRAGGTVMQATGTLDLRHNGAITRTAQLALGDTVGVGPYEVVVIEPVEGFDIALTVELTKPLGDDLAELKSRSTTELGATGLRKRAWSWALFGVVLALFLAIPIIGYVSPGLREAALDWPVTPDEAWESGELSAAHRFFGEDCAACHKEAFVQVRDAQCLACHQAIENHADPQQFHVAELTDTRCATCHKEHGGAAPIVVTEQQFCADCHRDLQDLVAETTVLDVGDFGDDHPEFRPAVIADPATMERVRISLDAEPGPRENSNLKFPHDEHLKVGGVRSPTGLQDLDCGSCHRADPGGASFLPLRMEEDCRECHRLNFEPKMPTREVPHGLPLEAILMLNDFYAGVALRGGFDDPGAPAAVRRRPGSPLAADARTAVLAWAEEKAALVADGLFGKSLCGSCHLVEAAADEVGGWTVAPVHVADRWFVKSPFDHASHTATPCRDCHEAPESKVSSDVLLPGIADCRECHGGETAADKVRSTCTMCHVFHRPELGPMRGQSVAAAEVGD